MGNCDCSCHHLPSDAPSLDKEIEEVAERLRLLRYRRNALSLVNGLPPEVLSHIFLLLQQAAMSRSPTSRWWIRVTHVCQTWRSAALSEPYLWTHIYWKLPIPDCAREFISRAKTLPLSFHMVKKSRKVLKEALVNSRKASRLEIRLSSGTQVREYNACWDQIFPELRFLKISSSREWFYASIPGAHIAPKLQSITLRDTRFSWASLNPYVNLISLVIRSIFQQTSSADFRLTLSGMKNLQILSIDRVFIPDIGEEDLGTIVLPSLRFLYFQFMNSKLDRCAEFIQNLEMPSLAHMAVEDHVYEIGGRDINSFMTTGLIRLFNRQSFEPTMEVTIGVGLANHTVTIHAWKDDCLGEQPYIDFRMKFHIPLGEALARMISATMQSPLGARTHTLRIHSRQMLPRHPMAMIWQADDILGLRTVHLAGPSAQRLLLCLPPAACSHLDTLDMSYSKLNDSDLEQLKEILHGWENGAGSLGTLRLREGNDVGPGLAGNVVHSISDLTPRQLWEVPKMDLEALVDTIAEDLFWP